VRKLPAHVAVCSLPWEKADGKPRTHNLLFRWTDDRYIRARSYSETVWKPALVRAGVMLASGVSVKELAEYLGHAAPGFTLRVYAHMMPGSHDRARRAIDERFCRPHAAATSA